jgi:hypothetical protein
MSGRIIKPLVEGIQQASGLPKRPAPEGTVAAGEVFDIDVRLPNAEGAGDSLAPGTGAGDVQPREAYQPAPPGTIHDEPKARVTLEGLTAYHGSPHRFDRFDISRIGTGEGAQAYGHGLYFAESEGVARSYRDRLGKSAEPMDEEGLFYGLLEGGIDDATLPEIRRYAAERDAAYWATDLDKQINAIIREDDDAAKALVDYARFAEEGLNDRAGSAYAAFVAHPKVQPLLRPEPGALYTTTLNVEPEDLLDWDLPLSQQSEKVRVALEGLGVGDWDTAGQAYEALSMKMAPPLPPDGPGVPRGWGNIQRGDEGHSRASAALREAGVPGIRYLDAGSRGSGDGTRNFVIFDDSLVDITHIDGKPLTPAERKAAIAMMMGGGAAAAMGLANEAQAEEQAPIDDSYTQHRTDLAGMTALDRLMMQVEAEKQEQQAEALRGTPQEPVTGPADLARNIGRDIAVSVAQTPRRVVAGGVRDAAQEALDLLGSAIDTIDNVLGDNLDADSGIQLPEVERPDGAIGEVGRAVVQFLTGFGIAGKAFRALGVGPAKTAGGRVADAAARGAVADFTVFDEHEERLSDLWQQLGLPDNVLTDYLAADPNDNVAEGRLKNALEGLGIGALADGIAVAAKGLAAAKRARVAQPGEAPEAAAERLAPDIPQTPLDRFSSLGDPQSRELLLPRPVETGVPDDVAAKGLTRAEHEPEFFVNWARIEEPDDVKNVMAQMADAMAPDIEKARRGSMSFEQIRLGAEAENAWTALQMRRQGQPLGAEQAVAARTLWAASAAKLTEVAKAAAETPSDANLFAFRKMLSVHNAIQQEVIAARTETARALASWRIPVGSDAMRAREIEEIIQRSGGDEVSRELAARVAVLADRGNITALDEVARRGPVLRTLDAVREVWINALLSSPKTHMVNMMSNTAVIAHQMVERAAAARISRALGTQGGVELGESMFQLFGLVQGMKDAVRYAGRSLLSGETGRYTGKIDAPRTNAISSEAFNISSDTWLGKSVDLLGEAARTPGYRLLSAEDEFFRTLGYRMELHAQALRQASREVRHGMPEARLGERIAELVDNPPDSLRLAAVDQAMYQTFQTAPGKITRKLVKLREDIPLAWLITPFLQTPSNIIKYTFERTPLAPLMSEVRADMSAGGARRDMAMARMSLGTTLSLLAADLAMSGQISGGGPVNREQRAAMQRSGWQPYSVKVGDRWFSYQRMDPPGMLFGMAADIVELTLNSDFDPNDQKTTEDLTAAMIAAIGNSVTSKTWLTGLSDFFEMMSDPTRNAAFWSERLSGTVVPSVAAEIRRQQDPYMREVRSMIDAMRNRAPGLSEDLPARRDLWGRPISYQSGLGTTYDTLSPIYSRQENPEPIDREILDQGFRIPTPGRNVSFDGVNINLDRFPGAYSRFIELSGNALELPEYEFKGAMDFLNGLVTGNSAFSVLYDFKSDGPEGMKEQYIRKVMADYRAAARDKLLEEYPMLAAEVTERQQRREELQMPVLQ